MTQTPCFPVWRARFAPRPGRTLPAVYAAELRRCTLDKLEDFLGPFLVGLPALDPARASARERPYSVRRTWWGFLWQMLQLNASCRDVVAQFQALFVLTGQRSVGEANSAYCQARGRLPESLFLAALHASAAAADQRVTPDGALQGRVVKVIDGTTLNLPDTAKNQAVYPQPKSQKPGVGFPQLHLLVVWSALGGGVLEHVRGSKRDGEMRLFNALLPTFTPGDIAVYDRAAGHYVACARLRAHHVDLISRVSIRKIDWRKGVRLGPDERRVTWKKSPEKSPYLTPKQWAELPEEIAVRVIRVRVKQPGFRTRTLVLVTTLLDPLAYPATEVAAAYLRRWRIELCLDDLKTVLGLEALRCKSPEMIHRELLALLVAHNLVRAVMAGAAREHAVALDRLSFTGSLDALLSFATASAQASTRAQRRRVWAGLLARLAADLVPLRPGRHEPRAVKRRPKSYPHLNRPRRTYRIVRHGSRFRRPAKIT
jgi:hypothetical protein